MKTVLLVGLARKSIQQYILEHGYEFVLLKDIRKSHIPHQADARTTLCDFTSFNNVTAALQGILATTSIDGVYTTYENYVLPAAQIAAELGLPGMPTASALACTDKQLMRDLFAAAPEKISPAYIEVKHEEDLRVFAAQHGFPLILKPANLAKSLMVTKSNTLDELLANYRKAVASVDAVYRKYAPNRVPKLILEEFMEGPIHSVDAFVDSEGVAHVLEQVVDYQTGYDIGYDDNFHYSRTVPSSLSVDEIKAVRHVAALGCQALGMRNSPAHIEIIRTTQGPMIVEIGARNGGYRERMHGMAHGIDITKNAIALALNKPLALQATKDEPCAVLELFPKVSGTYTELQNEATLRTLPSLQYLAIKQEPGTYIGKSSEGYKMSAIIILHHSDTTQFNQDLEYVHKNVTVVTTNNQ